MHPTMSQTATAESAGLKRAITEGRRNASDLKKKAFSEVRGWKTAFFVALAVVAGQGGALGYVATRPKFVPYTVAVDRHGVSFPVGPASEARAEDPAVIATELNRWVQDIRTVTSDPEVQAQMVNRAYAYVAGDAGPYLNAYFRAPANDPRVLARRSTRRVDVRSALPVKPDSPEWVVLWDERITDTNSGAVETTTWQAYATVKRLVPPRNEDRQTAEQARVNAFRLYVTDLSWGQVSNPSSTQRGAL